MLRHVACGDLLDRLKAYEQHKGRTHLATNGSGVAFVVNGCWQWDMAYGSSWVDCDSGYSTFIGNCIGSGWAKMLVIGASSKVDLTDVAIDRTQRDTNVAIHDDIYKNLYHAAYGHRTQGLLLRDDGIWGRNACLYDKGFRRMTVSKIEAHVLSGQRCPVSICLAKPFIFECGPGAPNIPGGCVE